MSRGTYILTYILFVAAQMLLSNYCVFTPYVMLSILPVLVFFIPTRIDTLQAMLMAFVTGLAVDYLAEGAIGINALSLVPVAYLRRPLIEAICGNEPFEQKENITLRKYGMAKISLAMIIVLALFMTLYTVADCVGTRPFWFIAAKIGASVLASYLVSLLIINPLTYGNRR